MMTEQIATKIKEELKKMNNSTDLGYTKTYIYWRDNDGFSVECVRLIEDEDGETIANSESLLKLEQLYTSGTLDGLSGELREALLGYLGIGKKVRGYTSEQVRGALLKMRG